MKIVKFANPVDLDEVAYNEQIQIQFKFKMLLL